MSYSAPDRIRSIVIVGGGTADDGLVEKGDILGGAGVVAEPGELGAEFLAGFATMGDPIAGLASGDLPLADGIEIGGERGESKNAGHKARGAGRDKKRHPDAPLAIYGRLLLSQEASRAEKGSGGLVQTTRGGNGRFRRSDQGLPVNSSMRRSPCR